MLGLFKVGEFGTTLFKFIGIVSELFASSKLFDLSEFSSRALHDDGITAFPVTTVVVLDMNVTVGTIHNKDGQGHRINPEFLLFVTRFATSYKHWRQLSLFHISLALYIQNYCQIPRHSGSVPTITQEVLTATIKQMSITTVQNSTVGIVMVGT